MPYLFTKNIGFVQLPQCFESADIFQTRFKINALIPSEQDYFYHRIQASRNHNNSAIFCGTNAILSRKALEKIGGFATQTITEDFATGLMMERHGFKCIALPYDKVYGVNVGTIDSLVKQRVRWCRGCIQTYKRYKIIIKSGLNIRQKADYLSGIYYWFFGMRNIAYLLIPLLFSFFDIRIIQGDTVLFASLFLLQFIPKRFIVDILERRRFSSLWNRIYETILAPAVSVAAFFELIGIGGNRFQVTSKETTSERITIQYILLTISHIVLFCLNTAGLYIAIEKSYTYGFLDQAISIFWLSTNCLYLLFALIFDFSNSSDQKFKRNYGRKDYAIFSGFLLLTQFIQKEIKIKRLAIFSSLIIVAYLAIPLNSFIQYQKSIVIKPESLVSYNGELSVSDGKIINNKGEIVKLRGVSTHNLNWYGRVYTKNNIKEIVETWGINTLRIAVYTNPQENGYVSNKDQIKDIEQIINIGIDLDIYIIVDWHILKDNHPDIYKKEAIEFFRYISEKYANIPNIIYEICNEPNGIGVTWDEDIKPYAEELTAIIRTNSEHSIIIVGLANWSTDIASAASSPLKDKNTVYSIHFYAGDINSEKLRKEVNKYVAQRIPVIITECGPTDNTGDGDIYKDEFEKWMDFIDQNSIGWIIWQLSEKDESSSLLIKKEVQDRLDYIHNRYSEKELEQKEYHVNEYLSDTGKYIKDIFLKYNLQ